jgi:hypothetical protein
MARPEGLEPSTPGLEHRCAIQVSYGRVRCHCATKIMSPNGITAHDAICRFLKRHR